MPIASNTPSNPNRVGKELLFYRLTIGPLPAGKAALPFLFARGTLLLALCVFFLPTSFYDLPGFGAEPSWKLTLTRAAYEGWGFGDRLVWTYGPLGFLEWRYPYGIHPACYLTFDLLLLCGFLRFALDVIKSKPDPIFACAGLASLFTVKRMLHDQPSVALYCLLVLIILRLLSKPNVIDGAGLIVVSAIAVLFKMNFGLMGFFLCAVIVVVQARARQHKAAIFWLVLLALQIVLAWILAWRLHTRLWSYLKASLAFVREYGDMSWGPGPGGVSHWFVFGFFWLFVVLAATHLRKNWRDGRANLFLLLGGATAFVLYKTALIRSDYNHNKCFLLAFPILCLAFMVHGPETWRRLWRRLFLASTAYTSLLMVAEFGNALIYMQTEYLKVFFPINYVNGIKTYRQHSRWEDYVQATMANDPERLVSQAARELIGANSVDVFPFESTLVLGSGLNYQPRPIPLTYGVLGQSLEARNLEYLRSGQAPRFLLYVLGEKAYAIDGRYSLWEEPSVKRLVAQDYKPLSVFTNVQGAPPERDPGLSPVLLLQRSTGAQVELVNAGTARQRTGEPFAIPERSTELYAKIRLRKTLLGRLSSFLYRGSEVMVRFRLEDGTTTREMRMMPANVEAGVLVNYFVDDAQPRGLVNYLAHHSRGNPKCLELTIRPQRAWAYQKQFELSYWVARVP